MIRSILVLLLLSVVAGQAQEGAVTFANNTSTTIRLLGTDIHAGVALYGRTQILPDDRDDQFMAQLGATVDTFAPGLFSGGTRFIGNASDTVQLQVRAWTGGYASYEAAFAASLSVPGVHAAKSPVWTQITGGGINPTQPITGAGRFNGINIEPLGGDLPEPSAVSLALLAAAAFAFCARRSKRKPGT
jgi:hypothetical protein